MTTAKPLGNSAGMTTTPEPAEPATTPPVARPLPIVDVLSELALYVSAALIVTGLILPSIWKPNTFGFGGAKYNLAGIVQTLFEAGLPVLGLVVVAFLLLFLWT